MKEVMEIAIKDLAKNARESEEPHKAMQYAQAALNLAHALSTLEGLKR